MRALVVEDEALVRILTEDALLDLGYQVAASAASLNDAIRCIESVAFDFAVLDINLAGVTSYPAAELLLGKSIPFLFVTGYGARGVPPTWQQYPILQKPYLPEQLRAAIDRALQAGQAGRATP
jgi:CheY-like chemotaxis protein